MFYPIHRQTIGSVCLTSHYVRHTLTCKLSINDHADKDRKFLYKYQRPSHTMGSTFELLTHNLHRILHIPRSFPLCHDNYHSKAKHPLMQIRRKCHKRQRGQPQEELQSAFCSVSLYTSFRYVEFDIKHRLVTGDTIRFISI